jgi:hypothetical protein
VKAASLEKVQVGPNTIGGRMQMAKDAQEKEDEVWDARTNWDLTNTGMQYSPADSIF